MSARKRKKINFSEETTLDEHTAKQAGDFLFNFGPQPKDKKELEKWYSSILSAKTRVKGAKTMSALSYYDVLAQGFNSEAARIVGNSLKHLLIGDKGLGREEAKIVLKGGMPEEVEVAVGHES
jgi:hypothetical protein